MPLIFKLVSYKIEDQHFEIVDSFEGDIDLKTIHELFNFWDFSSDEIEKIKFITNSEQFLDNSIFEVKNNENFIIFAFTMDDQVKHKLQELFTTKGIEKNAVPDDSSESDKLSESSKSDNLDESIPELSPEIINSMNAKSVLLFKDPDFKNLINIYLNRPELFNVFSLYVQHGNIIEESLGPIKTINDLSDEELEYYQNLCNEIKHLNLDISNSELINELIKYKGHINLTLRSLLCK